MTNLQRLPLFGGYEINLIDRQMLNFLYIFLKNKIVLYFCLKNWKRIIFVTKLLKTRSKAKLQI